MKRNYFLRSIMLVMTILLISCSEGPCMRDVVVPAGGTIVYDDGIGGQRQYTDADGNGTISVPCGGATSNV